MRSRIGLNLGYLSVVPAGIAALSALGAAGVDIPNQPGVLLLAVAYGAYRGGLAIGLAGAAMLVLYTAIFFATPHHFFVYTHDNFARVVVIALVAPAMGLLVGLLRREADRSLARHEASERALATVNAELEQRVTERTSELLEARYIAEASQALAQHSEERIRDFAEIGADWLWEQDADLRFSFFSDASFNGSREVAQANLGKTRHEVGNGVLTDAEWDAHAADLAARRSFRNLITKRTDANGTVHYTSTSGKPLFDEDGEFCGYRGTARDITATVLAEIELERRVAARTDEVRTLQHKLLEQERRSTLDQLTATVSHELRNPLSAIRNSVYALTQGDAITDPRANRQLERIDRSVQRCENFIAQLAEYSQIRALSPHPVALDTWLGDALDRLSLPPAIVVDRALAAGNGTILADPDCLRRVIAHLVENSIQAMEAAADAQPQHHVWHIDIQSRCVNGRAQIIIADNGPGMSPEVLERAFEPLFSTKSFGVGLGLPLVKQILDFHGGGIEITSAIGRGAKAIVWLPLATAAQIAA